MAVLLGGLALFDYGYKILSGVSFVSDTINKYTQKPEVSFADKLELKAIERRLNSLVLPLNHCIIANQRLSVASKSSLSDAKGLIEELIKFLSDLPPDLSHQSSLPSAQLKYFRKEMDFVSLVILSTLSVSNYSTEEYKNKCTDTVSLSALLKASQRLSSMTDVTGTICVTKGKFFSREMQPDSPKRRNSEDNDEEIKEESKWKQEGMSAELIISLNMMLNMYVLQVYIQDKSDPSNVLHMGRKDTQIRRVFYINYDLCFKYIDAATLGLSQISISESSQSELAVSSELMKSIKNFVFCWKYTMDPDNLKAEAEDRDYAFFPESCAMTGNKEMLNMNSSKELTELDILYLVKLCGYENEHLINVQEENRERRAEVLFEEIQKQKEVMVISKDMAKKKDLAHLKATSEELYSLLKNN